MTDSSFVEGPSVVGPVACLAGLDVRYRRDLWRLPPGRIVGYSGRLRG